MSGDTKTFRLCFPGLPGGNSRQPTTNLHFFVYHNFHFYLPPPYIPPFVATYRRYLQFSSVQTNLAWILALLNQNNV